MDDLEIIESRVIFKPLENLDLVAEILLDASGCENFRTVDLFTDEHEEIKATRLGKEICKIDYGSTVMSAILWELWKESKHVNLAISNQSILDKLRFLIGEEYFSEAREAVGQEGVEEFCDRMRDFLNFAKKEYYSGIFGCILKANDALWRKLSTKKSHDPLL